MSERECFFSVKYVTAASVDHSQGKKVNREFLLLMEICPGGEDDFENSYLDPNLDSLNACDPDLNAGDLEPYRYLLWCLVLVSLLFRSDRRYRTIYSLGHLLVVVVCTFWILCKCVLQNGREYSRTQLRKVSKSLQGDLANYVTWRR